MAAMVLRIDTITDQSIQISVHMCTIRYHILRVFKMVLGLITIDTIA